METQKNTNGEAAAAPALTGELGELSGLARFFVASGLFPDTKTLSQAVVKILAGRELGIGPFAAMRDVTIIQGRATLAAGQIAARIKGSGRYNYVPKTLTDTECELEFFENGQSVGTSKFTAADAKAAGLLDKDVWRKYPRNMHFARALTNGARWYCPDVFGGSIYTAEELGSRDVVETEIGLVPENESNNE